MKWQKRLEALQLLSVAGGLASAEYTRWMHDTGDDRELRKYRAKHDYRHDGPIEVRSNRYMRIADGLFGAIGLLVVIQPQRRPPVLPTALMALAAVGSGAMALVLRYEFIASDDHRIRVNHNKADMWPKYGVIDLDDERDSLRRAA